MICVNDLLLPEGILAVNLPIGEVTSREEMAELCRKAIENEGTGAMEILGRAKDSTLRMVPRLTRIGEGTLLQGRRVNPVSEWECVLKGTLMNVYTGSLSWLLPGSRVENAAGITRISADMKAESPENAAIIGETSHGYMIALITHPISTGGVEICGGKEMSQLNFEMKGFAEGDGAPFEIYMVEA